MLSIKEAKLTLQQIGMSEEDTDKFETIIEPFIEFHKYLMEKEDISSEGAEQLTQTATKLYLANKITGAETQVELFEMVGEGYKKYAVDQGYDVGKCDILETNLIELVNMFVDITTKISDKPDEKG